MTERESSATIVAPSTREPRSSMPVRYSEDPEELQELRAAADRLQAFADGIARMEKDVGKINGFQLKKKASHFLLYYTLS